MLHIYLMLCMFYILYDFKYILYLQLSLASNVLCSPFCLPQKSYVLAAFSSAGITGGASMPAYLLCIFNRNKTICYPLFYVRTHIFLDVLDNGRPPGWLCFSVQLEVGTLVLTLLSGMSKQRKILKFTSFKKTGRL